MKEIMLLVHRLPFPPDKGDKIRSFHLLTHLVREYAVHLGCFYDDPDDERYLSDVEAMCASTQILHLNSRSARLKSLRGLLSGQALSVPFYYRREMSEWVDATLQSRDISMVVTYSSQMGQYVLGSEYDRYGRIMDFVDVDSDKWRQYAERQQWPMSWVYRREAQHLLEFERLVAKQFDASVFVTANEVELFNELAPESKDKTHSVENGVATDFFDPALEMDTPFSEAACPIVFTGAMGYWANVDAVMWFAKDVFPGIIKQCPAAEFWIVGSSPSAEVRELTSMPGIKVTGRVADVRPYLKYAHVSVAPLRIARGIQNKVLEALAMGCSTICTSQALSGLEIVDPMPLAVADTAEDFQAKTLHSIAAEHSPAERKKSRQYAVSRYGWGEKLSQFDQVLKSTLK